MAVAPRDFSKYIRKGFQRKYLPSIPSSLFRHIIVIPVMDELDELTDTLQSLSVTLQNSTDRTAVLLVINHASHTATERKNANFETMRRLAEERDFSGGLTPGETLFWIDAATAGNEISRGVGEARRIGLDTALTMLEVSELHRHLLISLDADSPVAPEYLPEVIRWFDENDGCGAASLAVRHRAGKTPAEEQAIRRYERYMRSYVENLRAAGSPYAFHTIGSAMVCRADTYIAAGGMRVRSGGEDFYFMQALKKVAPLGEITCPMVFPAARPSDRVPFGTGPAIRSQLAGKELPEYPPEAFRQLKLLLDCATDKLLRDPERFRLELTAESVGFLENDGFFDVWHEVLTHTAKRDGAAQDAFHRWFDGLKTLRFIHSFMDMKQGGDRR